MSLGLLNRDEGVLDLTIVKAPLQVELEKTEVENVEASQAGAGKRALSLTVKEQSQVPNGSIGIGRRDSERRI